MDRVTVEHGGFDFSEKMADAIMTFGGEDGGKNIFETGK
jgi:hypothetical protein